MSPLPKSQQHQYNCKGLTCDEKLRLSCRCEEIFFRVKRKVYFISTFLINIIFSMVVKFSFYYTVF